MSDDLSCPLTAAVNKGDIKKVTELIRTIGLSNSPRSSSRSDSYNLLCCALSNMDVQIAKLLIRSGAEVNSNNEHHTKTPLHYAINYNFHEIVSMLIERKANVKAVDESFKSCLYYAVKEGRLVTVKLLLKKGAEVHVSSANPLYKATLRGNLPIIEELLKHGASINLPTEHRSLLHAAIKSGNENVFYYLFDQGADKNSLDENGKTILEAAVEKRNLRMVQKILPYYPELNFGNKGDILYTSLMGLRVRREDDVAISKALWTHGFEVIEEHARDVEFVHIAVHMGYISVVEKLLKFGANVNSWHPLISMRLLHLVATFPNNAGVEMASLLINNGADPYVEDDNGSTPIITAFEKGNDKVAKVLLSGSSGVKVTTEIFHTAVKNTCFELVKHILETTADLDVNVSDKLGRTALHFAAGNADYNFFIIPEPCGSTKDLDSKDPYHARTKMAEMFLARGAKVDAKTKQGATPLHFAAEAGYFKVAELLMKHNADVSAVQENKKTPLYLASERNNKAIVKMLLDKNVNINARNEDGATPLHIAVENGHKEVVKMLVEFADASNINDNDGSHPIYITTVNKDSKTFETLWERGANVDIRDNTGRTALHIAAKKGYPFIAETLLRHGANVNVTCNDLMTPLDYTVPGNDQETVPMMDIPPLMGMHFEPPYYQFRARFEDKNSGRVKVAQLLKRRIVLMMTLELTVHPKNVRSIDKHLFCQQIAHAQMEIARMKSTMIGDSNVSYYDVLTKEINRLAVYARNKSIIKTLELEEYVHDVTSYYSIFGRRFKLGKERDRLLSSSWESLSAIWKYNLPYLTAVNMLQYLDNNDLKNVIAAADKRRFTSRSATVVVSNIVRIIFSIFNRFNI